VILNAALYGAGGVAGGVGSAGGGVGAGSAGGVGAGSDTGAGVSVAAGGTAASCEVKCQIPATIAPRMMMKMTALAAVLTVALPQLR
jgi:hypothetical protein